MLDFFQFSNLEAIPEAPDDLELLGGLKLEEHKSLEPLWNIMREQGVQRIPFFEDTILGVESVVKIRLLAKSLANNEMNIHCQKFVSAIQKINDIFDKAAANGSGIVSFCD